MLEISFPQVIDRIKNVCFTNLDLLEVIKSVTDKEAVLYIDPTYMHETRSTKKSYKFEMSYEQHVALVQLLYNHPSRIFISGYHSPLYDKVFEDWTCYEFSVSIAISSKETQGRRTECLWTNRRYKK